MRCKTGDGETWTTVRVKEMRERLGLAEYGGSTRTEETMISLMKAAEPLGPARSGAAEVVRNQGGRIPPRATALLEPRRLPRSVTSRENWHPLRDSNPRSSVLLPTTSPL
jgi:hypothetical protein